VAALRIKPDFVESAAGKKLLTTVPVRKPHKHEYFRVREGAHFKDTFALIQIGDDREFYLVTPTLAGELIGEYAAYVVYTALNRLGTIFLWPVRLPDADGRQYEWWKSCHEAAAQGIKLWIRITSNRNLGAYEITVAPNQTPIPEWQEHSFSDLLRIAFKDHLIDSVEHPVVKQLRGLA
jgi:hypothetical protein